MPFVTRRTRPGGIDTPAENLFKRRDAGAPALALPHRSPQFEEKRALACVLGERRRPFEFRPGLLCAAEFGEKVAAHARQEMIRPERWLHPQAVDDGKAGNGPERHAVRHGAIELNDR